MRRHPAFEDLCATADVCGLQVGLHVGPPFVRRNACDDSDEFVAFRHVDLVAVYETCHDTQPIAGCHLGDGMYANNLDIAAAHLLTELGEYLSKRSKENS